MANYYLGRQALNRLVSLINNALKTKLGVNDQANGTKKLGNLEVITRNPTWGLQVGTGQVELNLNQCSAQARTDCPETGRLSILVDGHFYQQEGQKRVLDVTDRRKELITLTSSGWNSSNEQKITSIKDLKVDESLQAIFPTPSKANWKEYYEAGIVGFVTAANELTFYCLGDKPTKDLKVYIFIASLE